MDLKGQLRKTLNDFDALQARLSAGWRPHSNRRTMVIILVVGALAIFSYLYAIRPPDDFPTDGLVSVDSGMPLGRIAQSLYEQKVIRSPLAFEIFVRILGRERGVQAGDYLFNEPKDSWTIAKALSIGAFGLEPQRVRIPEGATTREMASILAASLPRFDADAFLLEARPQEGYLFPDTYFFLPNANEQTVVQAMRQNFDTQIAGIQPQIAASGHSLSDIVIMASIIEREARNPTDRRLISGVLWNRIKKGMPLQVDATFLYTIGKNTFQLTTTDLKTDNPYNTYTNKGLPPGPIGSPSLDSLEAAADPTPNSYLYYLADKNGVTHYAKTYVQHLANKAKYLGT